MLRRYADAKALFAFTRRLRPANQRLLTGRGWVKIHGQIATQARGRGRCRGGIGTPEPRQCDRRRAGTSSDGALAAPAGLLRRLAAGVYDALLLLGLVMIGTVPVVALLGEPVPPGSWSYQFALLLLGLVFFAGFWSHDGQTLGMRAWRLRVTASNGDRLSRRAAVIRYLAALVSLAALGIGFIWMLFDPDRLTWHDRWSHSRVVVVPNQSVLPKASSNASRT